MTNIMEQITFYGDPEPLRGPGTSGSSKPTQRVNCVADAVADGRFLVLTTDEARDDERERGDIETYLDRIVEDYT